MCSPPALTVPRCGPRSQLDVKVSLLDEKVEAVLKLLVDVPTRGVYSASHVSLSSSRPSAPRRPLRGSSACLSEALKESPQGRQIMSSSRENTSGREASVGPPGRALDKSSSFWARALDRKAGAERRRRRVHHDRAGSPTRAAAAANRMPCVAADASSSVHFAADVPGSALSSASGASLEGPQAASSATAASNTSVTQAGPLSASSNLPRKVGHVQV